MNDKQQSKPPEKWGTSAAAFYADCEGKTIHIHLDTGGMLTGMLLGVDRWDIVIQREDETRVLIPKHAIASIEPGT